MTTFFWLSLFLQKMLKCQLLMIIVWDKRNSVLFLTNLTSVASVFTLRSCALYHSVLLQWMSLDFFKLVRKLRRNRLFFLMRNSICSKFFKQLKLKNDDCIVMLNFFVNVTGNWFKKVWKSLKKSCMSWKKNKILLFLWIIILSTC